MGKFILFHQCFQGTLLQHGCDHGNKRLSSLASLITSATGVFAKLLILHFKLSRLYLHENIKNFECTHLECTLDCIDVNQACTFVRTCTVCVVFGIGKFLISSYFLISYSHHWTINSISNIFNFIQYGIIHAGICRCLECNISACHALCYHHRQLELGM